MSMPMSEKEKMVAMLTEVFDQLQELESGLEASFSDQRYQLNTEEQKKLTVTIHRLEEIEEKLGQGKSLYYDETLDSKLCTVPKSLNLELGF